MATWFGSNGAVQVDLASMTVSGGHAAGDVLVGIENLRGTAYADRLTGDGAANRIEGQFGDDVILGGAGDDILLGEGGSDRLTGGAGRDSMRGGTGADHFIYARILDLSTVQVMIDVIEDFRSAERDLIDLAAIDANPVLAGDQALQFVGTAGLTAIG
jgi:Ca2+-binding RTX toxin-like protein